MLFDFFNYLYNNDLNDYLNCYSTFLLTKKDLKKNILNIRMNILIDTYLKFNKKNKFDYYYYYLQNYRDEFTDKPLIVYNFKKDEFAGFDDDITDHYKFMITKNPVEEVIDYDELDRKYIEAEKLKEEEKEYDNIINDDDYYDDYYDDDYEYYEDEDYYYEDDEYYEE
jgi:hypothetical protein